MRHTTKRRAVAVAISAVTAIGLAGCAAADTANDIEVSTTITDEDVNLTFVYYDDPPTQALIDAFTAEHPNVTITPQQIPFSDYVTSIKLSLSSDDAPDIAQYNPAAMRPLVAAGLILPLDPWAEAYGWEDKFPVSNLQMLTSDAEAKTYGVGNLYAVPGGTKFVGMYYNSEILDAAGVAEVPGTIDELNSALKKVDAAGYRGFSVGGMETGIVHLWAAVQNSFSDVADYQAWVFGQENATIEGEAQQKATDQIAEWSSEGYIMDGASAVADSDALADFAAGKAAFMYTGNWAATAIGDALGDKAGFVPAPVAGSGAATASGGSLAYAISAKSANANVAAAFLDFLASDEAASIQLSAGLMPVGVDAEVEAEGLRGEILASYQDVIAGNGVVPFPDFATTGMLDKLKSGLQGVLSGHVTTEDFLGTLQKEWNEFHG